MNAHEFVNVLRQLLIKPLVSDLIKSFKAPPGRKPEPNLILLSNWYNNLREDDKKFVQIAMDNASALTLYQVLAMLDGITPFEHGTDKGALKLYYERNGQSILLNNDKDKPLTSVYKDLRQEENDWI